MTSELDEAFAQLDPAVQARLADCRRLLSEMQRVVVAISGGVDSSFLLALAL